MNIRIVGLQRKALARYIEKEHPNDFTLVEDNPEVVICYGGDGTLLYGEREFPEVPKAMVRNSLVCNKCAKLSKQTVLQLLAAGQYTISEFTKLEGTVHGENIMALNDIVVGHPKVNGTLRAIVYIDGQQYGEKMIADGIVSCTPIGSTGYYQSITRSNFQSGIGVAFNNSVNVVSHLVLERNSVIEVEITRGPAAVVADNDETEHPLTTGDRVIIRTAEEQAQIIQFPEEYLRYNVNTHSRRMPPGTCQICQQQYSV